MRWLALALVAMSSTASARRMPMPYRPAVVNTCAHAPSFDAVEKCLRKLGTATVVRTLPGARLVHIERTGDSPYDLGLALYVEHDGQWHVGGVYEPRGSTYELLDAAVLVVDKHSGFRIDIGELHSTQVSIDGIRTVPARFAFRSVLLCAGEGWACTRITTGCDVLVRGATMWTFHGTLSIENQRFQLAGDRSASLPNCNLPQTGFVGWPET